LLKKFSIIILVVFAAFLIYVATRDGHFSYARSVVINAPADKIFPYISDFQKAAEWIPYDRKDPKMKKSFSGPLGQVGAVEEYDGNSDVGSGKLEIVKLVPNQSVQIQLTMIKPMAAKNLVDYTLTPEGNGTKFTWRLSGENGFGGKLVSTIMNCEQLVAKDIEAGQAQLKALVEAQK
jgi:uncharacterized protein YndB with AHSA1/START domain